MRTMEDAERQQDKLERCKKIRKEEVKSFLPLPASKKMKKLSKLIFFIFSKKNFCSLIFAILCKCNSTDLPKNSFKCHLFLNLVNNFGEISRKIMVEKFGFEWLRRPD